MRRECSRFQAGPLFRNCLLVGLGLFLGGCQSALGVSFNLLFDASTASAPAAFFTAFHDAVSFYESEFSDPITVNMAVGWGEIAGGNLNPSDIGESLTRQQGLFTYSQVRTALMNDGKTGADALALSTLGIVDPTHGRPFLMSNAEAKALGFLAGNAPGMDGWVGFRTTVPYSFDASNRSQPGAFDFIGLAEHEISEVMGRYGMTQNGVSSAVSPLDLFRYTLPGSLDLIPQNGAYFSIDGGNTVLNTFNGTGGGDLSDWLGVTADSYNAFLRLGQQLNVSAGDITEMDVIGYDAVPEPKALGLSAFGAAILLVLAFRRKLRRLSI